MLRALWVPARANSLRVQLGVLAVGARTGSDDGALASRSRQACAALLRGLAGLNGRRRACRRRPCRRRPQMACARAPASKDDVVRVDAGRQRRLVRGAGVAAAGEGAHIAEVHLIPAAHRVSAERSGRGAAVAVHLPVDVGLVVGAPARDELIAGAFGAKPVDAVVPDFQPAGRPSMCVASTCARCRDRQR